MKDVIIRCYEELPTKGVLVVVFSGRNDEVMKIVYEIQNIRKVFILTEDDKVFDGKGVARETTEVRKWLDEKSECQDLITSASVIAGFEWPSVLMITSNKSSSQFYVRNIVMRAMSRLIWLKTELLDDLIDGEATKQEVVENKKVRKKTRPKEDEYEYERRLTNAGHTPPASP